MNDSFEDLASILTAHSEIDWSELAKIDLNLEPTNGSEKEDGGTIVGSRQDKGICTSEEKMSLIQRSSSNLENNANQNNCTRESREKISPKSSQSLGSETEGNNLETTNSLVLDDEKLSSVTNSCKSQDAPSPLKKGKNLAGDIPKEHPLGKCMKKNLSDILHEGLLDSVLPYMLPKPAFSQPIIKKPMNSVEPKKTASLGSHVEGKGQNVVSATRDRDRTKQQKKPGE